MSRIVTIGAAQTTSGHSRWIASTSSGVRVSTLSPKRADPPFGAPGKTSKVLAPMLITVTWIAVEAP